MIDDLRWMTDTSEVTAQKHLINVQLDAAKYALYSAISAHEYNDKLRASDAMALYYLSVKLAYALNELWNNPVDIYWIINEF